MDATIKVKDSQVVPQPISGVLVRVFDDAEQLLTQATTDDDGEVEFSLDEGTYPSAAQGAGRLPEPVLHRGRRRRHRIVHHQRGGTVHSNCGGSQPLPAVGLLPGCVWSTGDWGGLGLLS